MIGKHFVKLLRNESVVDIGKTKDAKNVFSAVVSGDLELGDKYIFATEKIEELFSKKGVQRILSEDITSQAETIHNIYEQEAEEIPLPEQAVLLIEIANPQKIKKLKSVFGVTKAISAKKIEKYVENTKKPKRKIEKHKEKISSLLPPLFSFLKKKKEFILSLLILVIIISSISFYIKINKARDLTESVIAKIEEAKQTPKEAAEDRKSALRILQDAKNNAMNIPYYPFFSIEAESLLKQIEILMNETSGVFNIISMERFGKIEGKAFNFTPKFIFENNGNVYIFSDYIDIFYKIKPDDTSGSFLFLDRVPFEIERAFEDDGLFYFLNYVSGEVYYFDPKEEKTGKIEDEKELRILLRIKPSQYDKDFEGANYTMDKNQIVKTEDDFQKYFNFLSQIRIRDFVVSEDNQHIYLLSEREVFKTNNR